MSPRFRWLGALAAMGTVGWVWDFTLAPLGDSLTWHMCTGEFTSGQETEVTDGANSWDAGAGEVLRGADWNFIRGSDRTGSNCNDSNFENEVYMESGSWFSARGLSSSTLAACACHTAWDDIVFRSTVTWSNSVPSLTSNISIGQVALHEFGHALGFAHEDALIATMNSEYVNGGDLGDVGYRPHEDDYVGLVANRPGSSTGRNLMLSKFAADPGDAGDSFELWTDGFSNQCQEVITSSNRPEAIFAVIEGTASSIDTEVEWWLSADNNCEAGTAYLVASMSITISSNTPFSVRPPFDFETVPPGYYYICAEIDPDDTITESSTASDNDVQSESTILIVDCP